MLFEDQIYVPTVGATAWDAEVEVIVATRAHPLQHVRAVAETAKETRGIGLPGDRGQDDVAIAKVGQPQKAGQPPLGPLPLPFYPDCATSDTSKEGLGAELNAAAADDAAASAPASAHAESAWLPDVWQEASESSYGAQVSLPAVDQAPPPALA
eukprot:CAMPEP_0179029498 /NCGR_PEP_ID=MMETSP0796-20121207/10087_1 /TAXON_ID=73915 /ORGANISM="Pyrodinium bahamense, Strain pbaha01" /LENGTH=153 /DNA_ID=CAMNT_0020725663 /DNA_START=43 /DNA_END=500 /DNA_ORIENTATION=-